MDDFRRGSLEWSSKARKAEKRKCRQRLLRALSRDAATALAALQRDHDVECDLGEDCSCRAQAVLDTP